MANFQKLTPRSEDYSKWYNELVVKADLAEQSAVRYLGDDTGRVRPSFQRERCEERLLPASYPQILPQP